MEGVWGGSGVCLTLNCRASGQPWAQVKDPRRMGAEPPGRGGNVTWGSSSLPASQVSPLPTHMPARKAVPTQPLCPSSGPPSTHLLRCRLPASLHPLPFPCGSLSCPWLLKKGPQSLGAGRGRGWGPSRGLQVIKARSLVCSGGVRGRGTGQDLGSQHGVWGTEGTDVEPGSRQGGQAHLLSPHLDVVVGGGDNDVFR